MTDNTHSTKSAPGIYTILGQLAESLATRLQIASIEFSVARDNARKAAVFAVLAGFFGLFALVFISIALLVVFWEEHRVFVACSLAAFYTVVFLVLLGRAKNYAANLPYAFEESKQILQADLNSLRGSFNRSQAETSAGAAAPQPEMQPTKEHENAGK